MIEALQEKYRNNKIWQIALPTMTENILQALVGFVDSWLIARIGLAAVTGVGLSNVVFNVYIAVFTGLSVTTNFLIAKYTADSGEKARDLVKELSLVGLLFGLFFSLLSLTFGPEILKFMGASGDSLEQGLIYFRLVGGFIFSLSLSTVFSSIIRATGDAKTPLKINFFVNVINLIIDWLLIFGIGPFPALGVLGTSIGTIVARLLGMLLLFIQIQRGPLAIKKIFPLKVNHLREITELFLPASGERLIMRAGQVIYNSLIVYIGQKTFAAHNIAGTIETFTYMPAYGLSAAATILIGNAVGRQAYEEIVPIAKKCVQYGMVIMSLAGLVLWFVAPYLAQVFTSDMEAVSQVVAALRIDSFIQPFQAIAMIMVGVFQGLGDTKTPLKSTALGIWVFRLIGIYLLGYKLEMGIVGIWLAIFIDIVFRAVYLLFNFRQKRKIN